MAFTTVRSLGWLLLVVAGACSGGSASEGGDGGQEPGVDADPSAPDAGTLPGERDPLQQPFASDSIWNMPLGSEAVYVPANLKAIPGDTGWTWGQPFSDTDHLVFAPDAPMVDIRYSSVGWDGGDRCVPTSGEVLARVPMPDDFIVPNSGANAAAAFLMPDLRTLVQVQPLARCSDGSLATALVRAPDGDLYGDGILGAHGGSGMSTVGGVLRVGELRPGQQGPRHALKMTLYMKEAFRCERAEDCYRWPAVRGDSYALGWYGTGANNPNVDNEAYVMGALLALPPELDIASLDLKTEPGRQLAWTLQNYGAYVVDDSWDAAVLLATEDGPRGSFMEQFRDDWGYDFIQPSDADSDWPGDFQKIFPRLQVVDNNGPGRVGGGGTPRQPLAAPLPAAP